jgi:hypothetical protein
MKTRITLKDKEELIVSIETGNKVRDSLSQTFIRISELNDRVIRSGEIKDITNFSEKKPREEFYVNEATDTQARIGASRVRAMLEESGILKKKIVGDN